VCNDFENFIGNNLNKQILFRDSTSKTANSIASENIKRVAQPHVQEVRRIRNKSIHEVKNNLSNNALDSCLELMFNENDGGISEQQRDFVLKKKTMAIFKFLIHAKRRELKNKSKVLAELKGLVKSKPSGRS